MISVKRQADRKIGVQVQRDEVYGLGSVKQCSPQMYRSSLQRYSVCGPLLSIQS